MMRGFREGLYRSILSRRAGVVFHDTFMIFCKWMLVFVFAFVVVAYDVVDV